MNNPVHRNRRATNTKKTTPLLKNCRKYLRVVAFVVTAVAEALWRLLPLRRMSSLSSLIKRRRVALPLAISGIITVFAVSLFLSAPPTDAGQQTVKRIFYRQIADITDLDNDTVSRWQACLTDMPEPCIDMRVKRFTTSYGRMFNDSNYVHWEDARKIGLEPMSDTRSHWQLRRPLIKMTSCEDFFIEDLKFSRPYLVPEAAAMLHEIGRRFRDTLDVRGGGDYRIKVTSLLRTPSSVARLRRRNGNAVDSSVHQLGTTVDISYSRFVADSDIMPRSQADLKAILAEVLEAMRNEGKCWVKHERKQPCFHITARPAGSPPPQD